MAVLLNPYCTLAEVQKESRNADSAQVDWFKTCINSASRWVDEYTQTDFLYHNHASTALDVKYSFVIGRTITLPWKILTLTEIVQDDIVLDPDYYRFDLRTIYAETDFVPFDWKSNISVKGTFGYVQSASDVPPTDIPPSVTRATVLLACAWTMFTRREVIGYEGGKESLLDSRIPKEVPMLLKAFKKIFL